MPLAKDTSAATKGKPSGTTKGEATNQQPKTTTTDNATAGLPTGQAPATTSGAPGGGAAGTVIDEGGLKDAETGQAPVVNKQAVNNPDASQRARPDEEFDKAKVPEATQRKDTFDPTQGPGFHVMGPDNKYLGTYNTEEDAQAFIDGHVKPQDIDATIKHGSSSSPDANENDQSETEA